ncbi:helix-turn-helix transcriptional regulator [Leucobacter luti]|uniref:AraC-like DNA-binding protein n=1 Tax=Leucobacter luti TaxID=340320 RepID=A0A4R6RX50_9MICO|nr:AraC family transcriptional regulator [Leucobacter luti]QYM75670.1 AraC family transcriptional regulator [Leucobacter luti]TDP91639.1 AraC-like DNA-binding protein [Leucobacter luti]
MAEIDAGPFERLLESVDLTVHATRRVQLLRRQRFVTVRGATTLIYVDDGELRGAHAASCAVGSVGAEGVQFAPRPALDRISAGSALVTLGREALSFEAPGDARLIVVSLELSETAHRLHQLLPDPLVISDFDVLEPPVAALASSMGLNAPEADRVSAETSLGETPEAAETGCELRNGDALICRLMARTVLLAVLRAWFTAGCAPQDWAARATDPHLERVLSAIHRDPGRDWSLDTLAGLGAMSRSAFAKRFRELLGSSPGQYLAGVRMEDAKRRLASGASVTQISRELGYGSDEGFSRAFRRHTGVVPSRWRSSSSRPVPVAT